MSEPSKEDMLANFGMELKPPVLPEEIIEVLAHCGGVEIVEELLEKYGHPTLSYLPCIAKKHKEVPVTFPYKLTLPDGNSYFLYYFKNLYFFSNFYFHFFLYF